MKAGKYSTINVDCVMYRFIFVLFLQPSPPSQ